MRKLRYQTLFGYRYAVLATLELHSQRFARTDSVCFLDLDLCLNVLNLLLQIADNSFLFRQNPSAGKSHIKIKSTGWLFLDPTALRHFDSPELFRHYLRTIRRYRPKYTISSHIHHGSPMRSPQENVPEIFVDVLIKDIPGNVF